MSRDESLAEIAAAREVIDGCDEQIIAAVAKRMKAARSIGAVKKNIGIGVRDETREDDLKARRRGLCVRFGAPQDLVEGLYAIILERSRKIQRELDESDDNG